MAQSFHFKRHFVDKKVPKPLGKSYYHDVVRLSTNVDRYAFLRRESVSQNQRRQYVYGSFKQGDVEQRSLGSTMMGGKEKFSIWKYERFDNEVSKSRLVWYLKVK